MNWFSYDCVGSLLGSHWAKIEVLSDLQFFLESFGKNPFPCLFQLLSCTLPPPPIAPSFLFKPVMSHLSDHSSLALPPSDPNQERFSAFKVHIISWANPENPRIIIFHLKFLNLFAPAKFLLPCVVHRFCGLGRRCLLGEHHSAEHCILCQIITNFSKSGVAMDWVHSEAGGAVTSLQNVH